MTGCRDAIAVASALGAFGRAPGSAPNDWLESSGAPRGSTPENWLGASRCRVGRSGRLPHASTRLVHADLRRSSVHTPAVACVHEARARRPPPLQRPRVGRVGRVGRLRWRGRRGSAGAADTSASRGDGRQRAATGAVDSSAGRGDGGRQASSGVTRRWGRPESAGRGDGRQRAGMTGRRAIGRSGGRVGGPGRRGVSGRAASAASWLVVCGVSPRHPPAAASPAPPELPAWPAHAR
jgi:hypothetical protein